MIVRVRLYMYVNKKTNFQWTSSEVLTVKPCQSNHGECYVPGFVLVSNSWCNRGTTSSNSVGLRSMCTRNFWKGEGDTPYSYANKRVDPI